MAQVLPTWLPKSSPFPSTTSWGQSFQSQSTLNHIGTTTTLHGLDPSVSLTLCSWLTPSCRTSVLSHLSLCSCWCSLAPTPNHLRYSSVGFLIPDSLLSGFPILFHHLEHTMYLSPAILGHSTELFRVHANQENGNDSSHLNQKQWVIWVVKELRRKAEWRKPGANENS